MPKHSKLCKNKPDVKDFEAAQCYLSLIYPAPRLWPATDTVPFHYPHPVTLRPILIDNSRAREGFTDG